MNRCIVQGKGFQAQPRVDKASERTDGHPFPVSTILISAVLVQRPLPPNALHFDTT